MPIKQKAMPTGDASNRIKNKIMGRLVSRDTITSLSNKYFLMSDAVASSPLGALSIRNSNVNNLFFIRFACQNPGRLQ